MNCRLGFCFAENSPVVERTSLWHEWGVGSLSSLSLVAIPAFTPTPTHHSVPQPCRGLLTQNKHSGPLHAALSMDLKDQVLGDHQTWETVQMTRSLKVIT